MPHYKDGTPAEIGDYVKGVPYNTNGKEIVGTLVQITEGTDSCNCIIAYVDPHPIDAPASALYPHLGAIPGSFVRRKGGRIKQHEANGEQEVLLLNPRFDYGAVSDFVKL